MRSSKTLKNQRGFSLIELLVVMVIIGLLAGLVGPRFFKHVDTAKQKDAFAQMSMLEEALDLYRLDKHKYPTTDEGLEAIREYLKKELPKDPWGHEYIYKSPGEDDRDYEIVCLGADGEPGGDGINQDIYNWKGLE